ncbi:hypothetical protein H0H87_000534, partial [Tephrocybe sp. NHM501043]
TKAVETALMESVNKLIKKNQIFGVPPMLKELLNLAKEHEDPDSLYTFDSSDDEIVAQVQSKMAEKSGRDDIIIINDTGMTKAIMEMITHTLSSSCSAQHLKGNV